MLNLAGRVAVAEHAKSLENFKNQGQRTRTGAPICTTKAPAWFATATRVHRSKFMNFCLPIDSKQESGVTPAGRA